MSKIIVSAVLLMVIHQIVGQCLTKDDQKPPQIVGRKLLYTGEQEFSLNLLRAVNQLNPEGNIFFSPYSTYQALMLAYFISAGDTQEFLKKTLRVDSQMDKADLMNAYKLDKFHSTLNARKQEYELINTNRIYVDNGVATRSCISDLFSEEFRRTDFANQPDESRLSINRWVENQTHGMIKDLLPPGSIDQTTNLALVNAAYFKGSWKYEFNVSNTKEDVFYITPHKRTLVKMMYMEGALYHDVSEVLEAHILELPYKGETISMYILLPPFLKEDGIANTLKKLTAERFQQVARNLSDDFEKTVKVSLPKFTLEHTIEMTPILAHLGVGNLFSSNADLSMLSNRQALSLSVGLHKAKIEVNEKGTQAAAATALFDIRSMDDDDEIIFKCDHPFILEKLGVGNLFTESGNLSSISDENLRLSNALHKAKIEVNEQGTEAAAATVLFSFRSSRPAEPTEFKCNYPFIYIIYDKVAELIVFMGVFRRPY